MASPEKEEFEETLNAQADRERERHRSLVLRASATASFLTAALMPAPAGRGGSRDSAASHEPAAAAPGPAAGGSWPARLEPHWPDELPPSSWASSRAQPLHRRAAPRGARPGAGAAPEGASATPLPGGAASPAATRGTLADGTALQPGAWRPEGHNGSARGAHGAESEEERERGGAPPEGRAAAESELWSTSEFFAVSGPASSFPSPEGAQGAPRASQLDPAALPAPLALMGRAPPAEGTGAAGAAAGAFGASADGSGAAALLSEAESAAETDAPPEWGSEGQRSSSSGAASPGSCEPQADASTGAAAGEAISAASEPAPSAALPPASALTQAHALVVAELLAAIVARGASRSSHGRGGPAEAPPSASGDEEAAWRRALLTAVFDGLGLRSPTVRSSILAASAPLAHRPGSLQPAAPAYADACALAACSFAPSGPQARAAILQPLLTLLRAGAADARAQLVLRTAAAVLGVHWERVARGADAHVRQCAGRLRAAPSAPVPTLAATDAGCAAHLGKAARVGCLALAAEGAGGCELRRVSADVGFELVVGVSGFAPPPRPGAHEGGEGGSSALAEPWRVLAIETDVHEVWSLGWGGDHLETIARALHGSQGSARRTLPMRAIGAHAPAMLPSSWTAAAAQAKAAGRLLAEQLARRALGSRPATLLGFSLGARVVFHALECLVEAGELGLVLDVALVGAAVTSRPERWERVRPAVSGRLVNAFASGDHFLRAHHRLGHVASLPPAGAVPIRSPLVENHDISEALSEHRALASACAILLRQMQVPLT